MNQVIELPKRSRKKAVLKTFGFIFLFGIAIYLLVISYNGIFSNGNVSATQFTDGQVINYDDAKGGIEQALDDSGYDRKGSSNPALRFRNISTGNVDFYFDHDGKILAYNITSSNVTSGNGWFSYLGSLASRITKGWFSDLDVSNNLNVSGSGNFTINEDVRINNSGVYYSNQKAYSRTADVVVCRGTSALDDLWKSFTCDVVCKSDDNDCLNELQSARDSISSTGGKLKIRGFMPLGDTFVMANTGVTIEGSNLGGIYKTTPQHTDGFYSNGSFVNGANLLNISGYRAQLRNLWIQGNGQENDCVYITSSSFIIDLVEASNCSGNGFTDAAVQTESKILNSWSYNNSKNGLEVRIPDLKIDNFAAIDNYNGAGILLSAAGGALITNTHVYGQKYGIYFNGSGMSSLTNSHIESSILNNLYFGNSGSDQIRTTITGNNFYQTGSGSSQIYFNSDNTYRMDNIVFIGNVFDESGIGIFDYSGTNIYGIQFIGNPKATANLGNYPIDTYINDARQVSTKTQESSEDLVGYWKGNKDYLDDSGYGNSGIGTDIIFNNSCIFGSCYQFNGTSAYVTLNNINSINLTNAFTITAWVNTKDVSVGLQREILTQSTGSADRFYLSITDNTLRGAYYNGVSYTQPKSSTAITADTWHFITYNYNNTPGSSLMTLDGKVQTGTDSANGALNAGTKIGADTANARLFNGTIDELMVFNKSLSLSEINSLYRKGSEIISIGTIYSNSTLKGNGHGYACINSDGQIYMNVSATC